MPRQKKAPPDALLEPVPIHQPIKRFVLVDRTVPTAREFIVYCQTADQAVKMVFDAKLGVPPYAAREETDEEARKRTSLYESNNIKGRVP
jgi:hypothetical protein